MTAAPRIEASSPSCTAAESESTELNAMPSHACVSGVWLRIRSITGSAPSIEIAKLTFSASASRTPAVLIPTRRPSAVDERPAGVAGVDRGVGLQQSGQLAVRDVDRPVEPGDDSRGHARARRARAGSRSAKTASPSLQRRRARQPERDQVARGDVDHREVAVGRRPDHGARAAGVVWRSSLKRP